MKMKKMKMYVHQLSDWWTETIIMCIFDWLIRL